MYNEIINKMLDKDRRKEFGWYPDFFNNDINEVRVNFYE